MENYGMMMWMYIKDIGKNFKLRELGNTKQKREHFLKVNGSKIDKMDLEWKIGLKEVILLDNILMEISMI